MTVAYRRLTKVEEKSRVDTDLFNRMLLANFERVTFVKKNVRQICKNCDVINDFFK